MPRLSKMLAMVVLATVILVSAPGQGSAQTVVVSPAPRVSYYPAPPVIYQPVPSVSFYVAPSVSYYASPVAFPAPVGTVTTYRYGLLPWRRVTVSTYGPAVVLPSPTVRYYGPVYVAP
jgi:hypothetical protein